MSDTTVVHDELFNPYPGHVHVVDKSSESPMYQTWLCSNTKGKGYVNLMIEQNFCEETGIYTKSLSWNGYERMRFTDTVPTVMKDLVFFMGGNSSPPTRVKSFWAKERDSPYCSDDHMDCVKPDGTTVPYGYVEWKYSIPEGQPAPNRKAKCICFSGGNFKCVGNNMKKPQD